MTRMTGIWVTRAHEFVKTQQIRLKICSFHRKFTSKEETDIQYQTFINDMNAELCRGEVY